MRERIIYSIQDDGSLKGVKTMVNEDEMRQKRATLKTRKTLTNLIKQRKMESESDNSYKKKDWYKAMPIRDRRQYNKTIHRFRRANPGYDYLKPEKGRFSQREKDIFSENAFLRYRRNIPMGTSLNSVPNLNLNNSPLYIPQVTEEEDKAHREGLIAWKKLKEQWSKSDTKKKSRKRPKPKSSNRKRK
jgi:hypothetical protein